MSEPLPGTKLTTITIDAATPDVIGALMQQITNKVIESIPEGTFEKIASEIVSSGEVVYNYSRYYNGSSESVRYNLSDSAKKYASGLIEKQINKLVEKHLESIETKKAIVELVEIGISQAMQEIPKIAAKEIVRRMTGTFLGTHEQMYQEGISLQNNDRINKISQELFNRQILNNII